MLFQGFSSKSHEKSLELGPKCIERISVMITSRKSGHSGGESPLCYNPYLWLLLLFYITGD